MIPYGRQDIRQEDIEAVVAVLRSDFLTQGPVVPQFESAVANLAGASHAVAMNSATSALHVACLALGLTKGDILWTSPITFVASANCGLYCGAEVDFVDIEPRTFNMCPEKLASKLEIAARTGRLPKIVVPVHMCGQSCDMKAIAALAKKYSFHIIEDASHAVGGGYQGAKIGNCAYSDITIFSFHPVKIITTAEGGMAMTNSRSLAEKMAILRSHGITRDPQLMTNKPDGPDGPWYYQQIELGYNYRMTDLQAALGLSQLSRIDEYVSLRHEIANSYDRALCDLPLLTPWQSNESYSAFHLYIIRLELAGGHFSHRQVFEELRSRSIGVNLHYIPVHLQPYYRKMGFEPGDYPAAEKFYAEAISLPMFPTMTNEQKTLVIAAVKDILEK